MASLVQLVYNTRNNQTEKLIFNRHHISSVLKRFPAAMTENHLGAFVNSEFGACTCTERSKE